MNNYGWGLPLAASSYAGQIDFGIWLIHAAMIAIFALWGVFFAYLLVKYRRRDGVPAVRDDHDEAPAVVSVPDSFSKFPFAELLYRNRSALKSLLPDLAVMAFEVALIVFYALPVWSRIKMRVPPPDPGLDLAVVAEQFGWSVHYPGPDGKRGRRDPALVHFSNPIGLDRSDPAAADDVVSGNELRLPLERTATIALSSKDVIHNFFVPEFRLKQDAVPGMEIPMWVRPTRTGRFEIACAQLCGFAHSLMRGDVFVQTPEEFEAWLKARRALNPAPVQTASAQENW